MKICGWFFILLSSPTWAMCDTQVKALRAEMSAQQLDLEARRQVNSALQPLLAPRPDLNPLSEAECRQKVQQVREKMRSAPGKTRQ
jgi:hypothetical protein